MPRWPIQDEVARFWAKVDKSTECWIWTAWRNRDGYGRFWAPSVGRRNIGAHLYSFYLVYGYLPKQKELHHICRNPSCIRPDHLKVVTKLQHNHLHERCIASIKSAQTHCIYGHEFTPENTRVTKKNQRICRECDRLGQQKRRRERHPPPKTHCIRGHEFTAENTYIRQNGGRSCRACYRERYAERYRDQRRHKHEGTYT